jgi:ATP-dependent Clp protease ATP-binding subunit ClpA
VVFERFTDRARQVVVLAQEQARIRGDSFIGTEHLLLGLIEDGECVACRVLTSLEVDLAELRGYIETRVGTGDAPTSGNAPFTPAAKKVLELSLREAISLGHNYIGTEHILLGLIRQGDGLAAQALKELGARQDAVRQRVAELVSGIELTPSRIPSEEAETRPRRGILRSAFRVEHQRTPSAAGRETPDPQTWPLCPRCRSSLAETARYRVLDVSPHEEGDEARAVPFAFCSKCGVWLGTIG